jgi:hypothetical protein
MHPVNHPHPNLQLTLISLLDAKPCYFSTITARLQANALFQKGNRIKMVAWLSPTSPPSPSPNWRGGVERQRDGGEVKKHRKEDLMQLP